jgi:hypothetical protein
MVRNGSTKELERVCEVAHDRTGKISAKLWAAASFFNAFPLLS